MDQCHWIWPLETLEGLSHECDMRECWDERQGRGFFCCLFLLFLMEEKCGDLGKATNEKREIEGVREKGLDPRGHGRAWVKPTLVSRNSLQRERKVKDKAFLVERRTDELNWTVSFLVRRRRGYLL